MNFVSLESVLLLKQPAVSFVLQDNNIMVEKWHGMHNMFKLGIL